MTSGVVGGIAICIVAACTPTDAPLADGPTVTYSRTGADGFDNKSLYVDLGAWQWRKVCFNVQAPPATDGDIHIELATDSWLGEGVLGLSSRSTNTIVVIDSATGFDLARIVAHEFGHILLDTGEHMSSNGVMNASPDGWKLTEADRDFACDFGFCDRCQ